MENGIKQEMKEDILKTIKKDLTPIFKKYGVDDKKINIIISDILIISTLSIDKNINLE